MPTELLEHMGISPVHMHHRLTTLEIAIATLFSTPNPEVVPATKIV